MKGAFCEIRQFGKLGALRLPLARESGIDYIANEVIVEPLSLALNTLSPSISSLTCCATLFYPPIVGGLLSSKSLEVSGRANRSIVQSAST